MNRWPFDRYALPADVLAPTLLGAMLVRTLDDGERLVGRIVEVEAYLGVIDAASHAFGGRRTPRNESMYRRAGTAYVYFTYGMHHCFNVVCGEEGEPAAVLIRSVEPVHGSERMREMRARKPGKSAAARVRTLEDHQLCSGPAKLCQAFQIDRALDGADMVRESRVQIAYAHTARLDVSDVVRTSRVGVAYAGRWASAPLRWYLRSNRHVSVPER